MVVLNSAEAELDEKLGELIVKSRHRLESDQIIAIRKSGFKGKSVYPKIVGAVSILLIQPDCLKVIDNEEERPGQLREEDTIKDRDSASYVLTEELTSKISMCLPASLSILPIPSIGNINSTCDIHNHSKMNKSQKEYSELFKMTNSDKEQENSIKVALDNSCKTRLEPELDKNVCTKKNLVNLEHSVVETGIERETLKDSYDFMEVNTSIQNDLFQDSVQVSNETFPTCSRDITKKIRQNFSCEFCGKVIPSFETIVQHALEDHQTNEVDNAVTCPLCSNSFNKRSMHDFLQHIRSHLKSEKSYESVENLEENTSVIDFSNVDLNTYTLKEKEETSSFYPSEFAEGQNATVVCDTSKMPETLSKNFENGQQLMSDCDLSKIDPEVDGKVYCTICSQPVSGYREIINHNIEHGKSNQCPICQKHFSMRGSLLRHCFSHTKNKLFPCHICSAVFTRKDNLKRHIHKHELYGKGVNKQNKVKEMKNKLFKFNFAAPKQERFTGFIRNKVFYKKLPSSSMKSNQISKNNLGIQNISLTNNISNSHDQHSTIDNSISVPAQETCFKETSKLSSDGKPSIYLIDSNEQVEDVRNLEERPTKQVSLSETNTILNYSCSMCSTRFTQLSSLKRHVIACHSEQSFELTEGGYHCEQTMPSKSYRQTDGISTHVPDGYGHIQQCSFYNGHNKINEKISYNPAFTGEISYRNPEKMENHEFSNTSVQFEFLNQDVIDIESLGNLPQFTPDKQIKEENVNDQQSYDGSELSSQNDSNQAIQSNFSILPASTLPPVSYTKENDQPIKSMIGRSNQNRRHRMLNSKIPICHFCGIYLESGAQIVRHGDDHQDQFENSCTCTICLQVLCGRDSLHRHAHSHIGISFDCDYCNACFSRKDNLKRHLKKVHNVETNKCLFTVTKN